MSDRNLLLPNRAFQQTLRGLQNRLLVASRRARFPGAMHMVEASGPTAVPNTPTWQNLVSFDLDRGRWLLTAGFWSIVASSPGDVDYQIDAQFTAGAEVSPVYTVGQGNTGPTFPASDNLMPTWTVKLAEAETINFRARRAGAISTCTANGIYMIATAG